MTSFALIGAAGYVAPRHMQAMKAVRGDLKVAYDPNDSVGIMDSHFPDAQFFTGFERFDRHIDKLRRRGEKIDYVVDLFAEPPARCALPFRDALGRGRDLRKAAGAQSLEYRRAGGDRAATPAAGYPPSCSFGCIRRSWRCASASPNSNKRHKVDLTYIASRGQWYHTSWKGDERKSGGVATNIGVHFFDMLGFVFRARQPQRGPSARAGARRRISRMRARAMSAGFCRSTATICPPSVQGKKTTFRSITVDGEAVEFSEGFTDLHTRSYEEIVAGRGFGLDEVRTSIDIVSKFRESAGSSSHEWRSSSLRVKANRDMSEMREDLRFPGALIHVSSFVDAGAVVGRGHEDLAFLPYPSRHRDRRELLDRSERHDRPAG